MRINIIPNIFNEDDLDIVFDEIVNEKNIKETHCEIETYESIEELKYPQEFEDALE